MIVALRKTLTEKQKIKMREDFAKDKLSLRAMAEKYDCAMATVQYHKKKFLTGK